MISYVVPVYRPEVYAVMARPNLTRQVALYDAEIIEVTGAESIYAALEEGRQRAKYDLRVYLHDDAALLDFDATPRIYGEMKRSQAALMGVIGARGEKLPWWTNSKCVGGWCSVRRKKDLWWNYGLDSSTPCEEYTGRQRPIDPRLTSEGFEREVDLLDGIFLAERFDRPWPERPAGTWHGYDAERCRQVRKAGGWIGIADVAVCHWNQPKVDPAHMEKHDRIMQELRGGK